MDEIIYTYTRTQAVADGEQIDVSTVAKEAKFRHPVFITRSVFDACVAVPPDVSGQDEAVRLWELLWMTRFAIRKATNGQRRLPFTFYVSTGQLRGKPVKLIVSCGSRDIDDPQPTITVMMPDED